VDSPPIRNFPASRVTAILFCCGLFAAASVGLAQKLPNWRVYKASDGLQESFSISFSTSQRSNIWVHHSNPSTLSWLDGYEIKKVSLPGLSDLHVYENRAGQIWAVHPDGLQAYQNGSWNYYPIKEIRAELQTPRANRSIPLLPLRQGHVLFLLPERLMEFSNDGNGQTNLLQMVNHTRLEKFSSMIPARDGGIWIGGKKGLAKIPVRSGIRDAPWQEFILEDQLEIETLQQLFEDDQGGITAVAESISSHKKVIVHFDGQQWLVLPTRAEEIRQAWRGLDQTFWFTTGNALFRLEYDGSKWIEVEELLAGQYFDAATEPNGAFWVATSEGVFRYAPLTWRIPPGENSRVPVYALTEDRDGRIWIAHGNGLSRFQNEQWKNFSYPQDYRFNFQPNAALFSLGDGRLAMGAGTGLLRFNPQTEAFDFVPHPSGASLKALGVLTNGTLGVQTFEQRGPTNSLHLETFAGEKFRSFAELPGSLNLGTELFVLFTAQNGVTWLGGNGGVAFYRDEKWRSFDPAEGMVPDSAFCMIEISEGKLWCGARDRIWQFDGKNWTIFRSGFDRVNAFFKSRDGSIWVASNSGVHRFYRGDWVDNGAEEGLPSPVIRQLLEDVHGRIWAGTASGLSLYHAEADADPPQSFIQELLSDTPSVTGKTTFVFGGRDKWKQTPAERLLFSYRLDEQEWSPFQVERGAAFSELAAGKHFFQVRAMDRNWNIDPKPALLEFSVPLPWYEETRLVLIAAAGLAAALFFAALAFNRHRRLVKSYAEVEKIVALRTKQLEKANQQLFQSQKMNALGTLAAGIAHDFNSILSIVKGSAQIIETNLKDSEKIRTRVSRIKTAVDQGSGIVKAMLGFSRVSDKQLAMCEINPLVEETVRLLGDRFQREVQVEFQPGTPLPPVPGSKDFIQQIALNFIFNAADALAGPGKIILRTGLMAQLPAELVLAPRPSPKYVFVAVRDFGCGIAPEILPQIFDPFFTTKSLSAKRGTGLGLSMVYELAKEMNCGLSVESTVGKGSTFTLILPIGEVK